MTDQSALFASLPGASLARRLGLGTATSVVVANMIGTGIFTTTGLMLAYAESGWLVLLAWLLGGLVAICGALSYAELATMMPHAGGEYVYLREIYGPLPAFLTGWTSFFVGFSAPVAASAIACAKYLAAADVLSATWLAERVTAAGIVLTLTAIHYCGLRIGAHVQNLLTGLKLLLLFGLIAVGFAIGSGSWDFLATASSFWTQGKPSQLGVTLLLAMFAYSGWNAAAYIAGEIEEPSRNLPRSLLLGTLIVTLIYLLMNLLLFFSALPSQLQGIEAVGEVAAVQLFGPGAARMISALIGIALLSSLSAYVLIGPRVYYAMAKDGLFFRIAARVHPRFHTPGLSILAQGACSLLMIFTGTFEQLLVYIGFALGIFPLLAVAGVFMLRRRQPQRERPYRVWGFPLVPLFFLLVMTAVLVVGLVNRPMPSLIALATVAAGIPAFWLTNWLARRSDSRSRG
jgi:basic amino acid/polyamine antiporter, APA family